MLLLVKVNGGSAATIAAAVEAAKAADVVVCVMGIDGSIEAEGHDRYNTTLPGMQVQLMEAILALGKPTVMVLVNGGTVSCVAASCRMHILVQNIQKHYQVASHLMLGRFESSTIRKNMHFLLQVSLGSLKDKTPAIVEAFYGGEMAAQAMADVLFGVYVACSMPRPFCLQFAGWCR